MRLVIVSDTHGWHESVSLPEGDVLLHGGDLFDGVRWGAVSFENGSSRSGRECMRSGTFTRAPGRPRSMGCAS